MKRFLKFIAWLAGLAIFLLITAHFTLRHALNTPKFKEAMTGFIERTTGRAADYERIDYGLFPFSLVIRNAALKEPGGAQDFASIRSFAAIVDFRAKEVSALRLEEPSIRIVQRADGTFNFSDLLAPPPAETPAGEAPAGGEVPPAAGAETQPAAGSAPPPEAAPPAAPAFAIRLVQIEKARFEFVREEAGAGEKNFLLSDLDFQLRDFAPDRPFRMTGRAAIGRKSALQFELSGPPPAEYAEDPGAWPAAFTSRLEIADFADLEAFLPAGTLPFESLGMTLSITGALAEAVAVQLDIQTSAASETHPVAVEAALQARVSLPAPVVRHVLAGTPLPDGWPAPPPPCTPPPGTVAPANDPLTALLLRHVKAAATISAPKIAYGGNVLEQGLVTLHLTNGVLTIPDATVTAYGGQLKARGNVQLLACPLSYQLEHLLTQDLALEQALAANGLGDLANVSGRLQLEASAAGQAVGEPALRALAADATARIDDLQSVGTGGSLMDQVWLQLDNPLLLKLVPRLQPKVDQAKSASGTVTTSRYEEATATLSLRDGIATLTNACLATSGYRVELAGTVLPFDDRMDLAARLLASPEETRRLTDGKDRSAYLPYENGGLMVPLSIRGPLQEPAVLPDLDRLLQNALGGTLGEGLNEHLDNLSDKDKKHVQEGLQLLQGLGTLLQGN